MRLNLPYFMCDDAVEFVLKAVKMVVEHGWKLLPQVNSPQCMIVTSVKLFQKAQLKSRRIKSNFKLKVKSVRILVVGLFSRH